jgi:hypothetical protein
MAYTPNYTEEDISEASVSTITKFIIGASTFVTVFIIVFVIGWVNKRVKLPK